MIGIHRAVQYGPDCQGTEPSSANKFVVSRRGLVQRTAASLVPQELPVLDTTFRNNHGEQAMDQKGCDKLAKAGESKSV